MATWKPAPSVPAQASGGNSPLTGKLPVGQSQGTVKQLSPSLPFIGAPAGNRLISSGGTVGSPL